MPYLSMPDLRAASSLSMSTATAYQVAIEQTLNKGHQGHYSSDFVRRQQKFDKISKLIQSSLMSLIALYFRRVEFWILNISFDFFHCACLQKTTTNKYLIFKNQHSKFDTTKSMSCRGHTRDLRIFRIKRWF